MLSRTYLLLILFFFSYSAWCQSKKEKYASTSLPYTLDSIGSFSYDYGFSQWMPRLRQIFFYDSTRENLKSVWVRGRYNFMQNMHLSNKSDYTYDSLGRVIKIEHFSYINGQWQIYGYNDYHFSGTLKDSMVYYRINYSTNQIMPNSKYIYQYDSLGKLETLYFEKWVDYYGSWRKGTRREHFYNSLGYLSEIHYYQANIYTQLYKLNEKEVFDYYPSGLRKSKDLFIPDSAGNWRITCRDSSFYDFQNRLVKGWSMDWDSNGVKKYLERKDYNYDSGNNVRSIILWTTDSISAVWVPKRKDSTIYNLAIMADSILLPWDLGNHFRLKDITYSWNSNMDSWDSTVVNTYHYSGEGLNFTRNLYSNQLLALYPIPAKESLWIEAGPEFQSRVFIIYDLNGRIHGSGQLQQGDNYINLDGYSKGTYVFSCHGYSQKFVKN